MQASMQAMRIMAFQLCLFFLLVSRPFLVLSRSGGAPSGACSSITPGHGGSSQPLPGGFFIHLTPDTFSFSANQVFTIRLAGSEQFRGFLIQARQAGTTTPIGSFSNLPSETRTQSCSGVSSASVTHSTSNLKSEVQFTWTAPSTPGTLEIRYAVVVQYSGGSNIYYANINAADYRPPSPSVIMSSSVSVTSSVSVQPTNVPSTCPTSSTPVSEFPLVFRRPENCERSSCEYYVGMGPNSDDSSYLDVYLEGNAAGWIAIGFSQNNLMESDDVLGCRVNSGTVTVVDTWNPSGRHAVNILDDTQNGLCVQSTSFNNGRISCRFSRTISITDVGQDYNLDNSFRLLFGRRSADQGAAMNLAYHTQNGGMTPTVSQQEYNPVRDFNVCPPTPTGEVTYTFTQGNPGDDYHFAARINPDNPLYLDMRLEGVASGWVGIGFSTNQIMENDDVLACQRNPADDIVAPVDTWNPDGRRTPNRLDPNQNGLCLYNADFTNGRIICTFSRLITNMTDDYNLNGSYILFFGRSNSGGTSSLAIHSSVPVRTSRQVQVAIDESAPTFPRRQLTKVHGILMLLAWPLLVVTAIFFAAWMKPALPNGEWFQIHRALMIASLVLTALGFIFIFVANAENRGLISFACNSNRGHFVIGFIVFILQIINPIIALFRCKPTDSNRWIFNIFHGSIIGFIAELLALTNVGIGIALFESGGCSGTSEYTILWVYIAFVAFLLILQVALFVIFSLVAFESPSDKRLDLMPSLLKYFFPAKSDETVSTKVEMTDLEDKNDSKKEPDEPPPKKQPSKDSPLRWGAFAVFAVITVAIVLVILILIAVTD